MLSPRKIRDPTNTIMALPLIFSASSIIRYVAGLAFLSSAAQGFLRPTWSTSSFVNIEKLSLLSFDRDQRKQLNLQYIPNKLSCRNSRHYRMLRLSNNDDNANSESDSNPKAEEAERLRRQAEILRQQIREMEEKMSDRRLNMKNNNDQYLRQPTDESKNDNADDDGPLKGKRILVVGANGRLGSMVCRYLLRSYPEIKEVVAAVHTVSENSVTSRGYGRLSYEVGAEDGIGSIGSAWDVDNRVATFEFDTENMSSYNLNKLRMVECELLDPIQCQSIVMEQDIDTIIWCATDFNGNLPRSISNLNVGLLFRAFASPMKGRVEIEGIQNIAGAYKLSQIQKRSSTDMSSSSSTTNPVPKPENINFVLVSMLPDAYENFETPFGEFNAMKRQSENLLLSDFPSMSSIVLQLGKFDDTFVEENLEINYNLLESRTQQQSQNRNLEQDNSMIPTQSTTTMESSVLAENTTYKQRYINRRDAAKATVDALLHPEWIGRIVQVHTAERFNSRK